MLYFLYGERERYLAYCAFLEISYFVFILKAGKASDLDTIISLVNYRFYFGFTKIILMNY